VTARERARPTSDGETTPTGDELAWHATETEAVLDALGVDEEGLTADEAARRREQYGENDIQEEEEISALATFLAQFRSFLIYLLIVAAGLSLAVGLLPGEEPNYVDAGLIATILLANGVFGFVQDYRAEKSIQKLRELASPDATVLRDGAKVEISAREVVPGDVVFVEQGDAVPADARLLSTTNLETDEAALTGESATVAKRTDVLDADAPLAERENMVYMNTNAVKGHGKAVVVATGMETEVGAIATQIQEAEERKTPFQREVDALGQRIGYGVMALIALVGVVQFLFTAASPISIALVGITLAVAAVPEGLPAVVTLTLAVGSRKMLNRNALVRRLPVVESLGSVDVIVTDKTGTLTESQMTVKRLFFGGQEYEVTGAGLASEGEFLRDDEPVDPARLDPLLRCGVVCNNAERAADSADVEYLGDPTEIALLVAGRKAGVDPDDERLREVPFSSDRRRMTVVVPGEDGPTAYMKGAPETVLDRCDRVLVDGAEEDLTDERREAILDRTEAFAGDALRVLGFARATGVDADADEEDLESGLVFLGLQGMIDPPREEVREAVADCRDAGIRVVMVTGDNLTTATAIGEQIGFDSGGAMTGREVAELPESELRETVEDVEVFARVAPEHKVTILQALQANGHDVAMTGDGVNDAPALRNADVGISMGERGTDVAKQASDMVLQDDNFVTIRDAIAEGRGIFDNIRKFVTLLLSANAGEVLAVLFGVLLGSFLFPELFASRSEALILTPVMLLWINLVTDGLPALALGVDPKAEGIMDRAPRAEDEPIIDSHVVAYILTIGSTMTVVGLVLFFYGLTATGSLRFPQTLLFTFVVVGELAIIQVIRSRFEQPMFSNRWLVGAVVGSTLLHLLVLYTPVAALFRVTPLDVEGWGLIAGGTAVFLLLNVVGARLNDALVGD